MQRWIKQANGNRQPFHLTENAKEIFLLHRQDLFEGTFATRQVIGQDHLAYGLNPVPLKKHVLSTAQPDPLGTKIARHLGIIGSIGIRAHLEATKTIGPHHQDSKIATDLRLDLGYIAKQYFAGRSIKGDIFTTFYHYARFSHKLLFLIIYFNGATTGNAAFSHPACNNCSMRSHPATGRQNAACSVHAMNILRTGFHSHKDNIFLQPRHFFCFVGSEDDLTAGCAGRSRQPPRDNILFRLGIQGWMKQLVKLVGTDPQYGFLLADQPFPDHLHGDTDSGMGSTFTGTGLQHVEFSLLDGKLNILHILVMLLEQITNFYQLLITSRHHIFHRRQIALLVFCPIKRLWGTYAGNHILTLGIDQVLPVEIIFPGRRVASKGDTGRTIVPHVAEYHCLYINSGPPMCWNAVKFPVCDRPRVHPGTENSIDCPP